MGIFVGVIAFGMDELEGFLIDKRWEAAQKFLDEDNYWVAKFVFASICLGFAIIAAGMTVYWGPGAAGSGVAETLAYINGVNYHGFVGIPTLITKIIAVVLAVCAGLKVGKEGPLAHIGSLVGLFMIYLPFPFTKYFRNDREKRMLVAAGAGVGVSVAFGAPIGGVLFAYEVSKSTSFWSFSLAWRTFIATSMANFVLAFLEAAKDGNFENVTNSGLLKFGILGQVHPYGIADIPVFAVIGILAGILGAIFVIINTWLNKNRKRIHTKKWMKFVEVLLFAFVGAIIAFILPLIFQD